MAAERNGPPPRSPPLARLLWSEREERRIPTGATLVSVAFHAAALAALAAFSGGSERIVAERPEEHVTYISLTFSDAVGSPAAVKREKPSRESSSKDPSSTRRPAARTPRPAPPAPLPPAPVPPELLGVPLLAEAPEVDGALRTLMQSEVVVPEIPEAGAAPVLAGAAGAPAGGGAGGGPSTAPGASGNGGYAALAAEPTVTPYTVAPELENRAEVARILERRYPPLLRDQGIGGQTVLWAFIDEEGEVVRALVKESSGHKSLDDAALKVVEKMRFSPAWNAGYRVPVWVAVPIRFQVM